MLCNNGPQHTHETVYQSKICWGIIKPPTPRVSYRREPSATERQINYAGSLGGDTRLVTRMTKSEASAYIDGLKSQKKERTVTQPATEDPRIAMIRGMLDMIPDGYFALPLESGNDYAFIRISTPKSGKYKGCRKIQTQHGDRLVVRASAWPSGAFSIYDNRVIDPLQMLISDSRSAAIKYGQEIGRCCRCGKQLTDERSRHYGIGPECVGYWPWVVEQVDSANAS